MLRKLMPESTPRRGQDAHRATSLAQRIYSLVNAGLWAVAVAAAVWVIALLPQIAGARSRAEMNHARALADEDRSYCEKWGMPAGTPRYATCLLDLTFIRESTRRDLVESEYGLF